MDHLPFLDLHPSKEGNSTKFAKLIVKQLPEVLEVLIEVPHPLFKSNNYGVAPGNKKSGFSEVICKLK
jgi:hypothetical protein